MSQSVIELVKENLFANFKDNIISIILFGSYSTNTQNINSDIDLLILTKNSKQNKRIEKFVLELNNKVELQMLTNKEFKKKTIEFNPQLISIFTDGIILYDKNKFFYKNRNLFIALNYGKEYSIKYKNKSYSITNMVRKYGF